MGKSITEAEFWEAIANLTPEEAREVGRRIGMMMKGLDQVNEYTKKVLEGYYSKLEAAASGGNCG